MVIQLVKETLTDPKVLKKVEEHVEKLLLAGPEHYDNELERLQQAVEQNARKKQNILEAIELRQAGPSVATLIERLEELESEAQDLDRQLRIVSTEHSRRSQVINNIETITEFMLGFEHQFENAYPHEKKLLMKRCVSQIVVDRDEGMVNLAIRLVPAATAEIEALYRNKTALTTEVVSAACSGDRT